MSLTLLALLSSAGAKTTAVAAPSKAFVTTPFSSSPYQYNRHLYPHRPPYPTFFPTSPQSSVASAMSTECSATSSSSIVTTESALHHGSSAFTPTNASVSTTTTIGTATATTNGITKDHRSASPISAAAAARLVYGRDDALFGCIEKQQGSRPFGRVLDAGTGLHSLRWLATLVPNGSSGNSNNSYTSTDYQDKFGVTDFVAITADATMQRNCQRELEALGVSARHGQILLGNWFPTTTGTGTTTSVTTTSPKSTLSPSSPVSAVSNGSVTNDAQSGTTTTTSNDAIPVIDLEPESFDVILADYLIGALDGFAPYQQDEMIPKLTRLLKPGGRLYIVGLEPIPDEPPREYLKDQNDMAAAKVVCQVRQVRDACILLAGHRCYREYPVSWIHRQIESLNQAKTKMVVLQHTKQFPILYRHATIVKQINVGRSKLPYFASSAVREAMRLQLNNLEAESRRVTTASPSGRIQFGFDYVVTAEKIS